MKTTRYLCVLLMAALAAAMLLTGCPSKGTNQGAPTPPPMKMNGQNVPSEGAHYMQQMQQGKPVPGNGAR